MSTRIIGPDPESDCLPGMSAKNGHGEPKISYYLTMNSTKSQLLTRVGRTGHYCKLVAVTGLVIGFLNSSVVYGADQSLDGVVDSGDLDLRWTEDSRFDNVQNASLSKAEAQQKLNKLRDAVRADAKRLRKMSEKDLKKLANEGNIVAQLVLAETFATEAHTKALTVGAANAALGDALRWYSVAAKRGFPGAISIDKILPVFPVRIIRGP